MWDVQVEKQDLNKAGTPSLLPGGCHLSSTPNPSLPRLSSGRETWPLLSLAGALYACGQALLGGWHQCFKGLRCRGWLWECQARGGAALSSAHGGGRKSRTRGLPGLLARRWCQPLPPLSVPSIMALSVPACFPTQPPSLTGRARALPTPGMNVGWGTVPQPPPWSFLTSLQT